MKVKASVSLSEELLKVVDKRAKRAKTNRSDFIEQAVWTFVRQLIRAEQNARDLAIINRHADRLNAEAEDAQSYQTVV